MEELWHPVGVHHLQWFRSSVLVLACEGPQEVWTEGQEGVIVGLRVFGWQVAGGTEVHFRLHPLPGNGVLGQRFTCSLPILCTTFSFVWPG